MGTKSIEEQVREEAELSDRLFAYRFEEIDKRWDAKLDKKFEQFEEKLDQKFEQKLEEKLEHTLGPIRRDLAGLTDAMKLVLTRLP